MDELANAYETLDLKPGASFKKISEAREDLLALWDPDRLSHYPRLRSRAQTKIREINEAYDLVTEHLRASGFGGGSGSKGRSRSPGLTAPRNVKGPTEGRTGQPTASLFDEVFSDKGGSRQRKLPMWPVVVVVFVLIFVILFLLLREDSPTEEDVLISGIGANPGAPLQVSADSPQAPPEGDLGRAVSEGKMPEKEAPDSKPQQPLSHQTAGKPASAVSEKTSRGSSPKAKRRGGASSPVLLRTEVNPPGGSQQNLSKNPDDEKYFEELVSLSPKIRRLVEGALSDFRFVEWNVLRRDGGEIWLEIVAQQGDGEIANFIWSLDVNKKTIQPLNATARDLSKR